MADFVSLRNYVASTFTGAPSYNNFKDLRDWAVTHLGMTNYADLSNTYVYVTTYDTGGGGK